MNEFQSVCPQTSVFQKTFLLVHVSSKTPRAFLYLFLNVFFRSRLPSVPKAGVFPLYYIVMSTNLS